MFSHFLRKYTILQQNYHIKYMFKKVTKGIEDTMVCRSVNIKLINLFNFRNKTSHVRLTLTDS